MGMLFAFGIVLSVFLAKSDAAVTFTTPTVGGSAACPTTGTVAEGTTSGALVTVVASSDTTGLAVDLPAGTTNFGISGNDVSIAAAADLDFEAGSTVNVLIVGNDDDTTPATATCVLTLTDVAPWVSVNPKSVVVSSTIKSGVAITAVVCTDGGGTIGTYALASGDDATAKFSLDTGTGAVTKSVNAFDTATKTYYSLVITCTDGTATATATVGICLDNESNCPSKASINTGILAALTVPTLLAIYNLI